MAGIFWKADLGMNSNTCHCLQGKWQERGGIIALSLDQRKHSFQEAWKCELSPVTELERSPAPKRKKDGHEHMYFLLHVSDASPSIPTNMR